MKPQTGIVLRLLGPLLQVICIAFGLKTWGTGRDVLGIDLDSLLMLGFFLGMVMVVAGLTLVKKPTRAPNSRGLDLDLDREAP